MKKTNMTPVELARQKGQSLDWIYRQIRVGKIYAIKQGKQWVIPAKPAPASVNPTRTHGRQNPDFIA
jgi:hypothetical protein